MDPEAIEETLTDMMMWSEHKWRDGDCTGEGENPFAQSYALCVIALQLGRLTASLRQIVNEEE